MCPTAEYNGGVNKRYSGDVSHGMQWGSIEITGDLYTSGTATEACRREHTYQLASRSFSMAWWLLGLVVSSVVLRLIYQAILPSCGLECTFIFATI